MKFIIKNRNKRIPDEVLKACNNDELIARLMFNRGINTLEKAEKILDNSKYTPYNPLTFPRIDEAVDIVLNSINNNEKIAIYGDYDADGVTATTLLVDALRKINADVSYHVPDRFSEGYGMNCDVVRQLAEEGVKTIITCDCGIANFNEIDLAKEINIKVVLTDHHTIGADIPNADVVINPKLLEEGHQAREISGCATAYYLIKAIYNRLNLEGADNYLDLVALSTIADVMPLIGESRYLLKKGFPLLMEPKRVGLKALLNVANINISNEEDLGFQITPRINAAGRMESARIPIEMFLSTDENEAMELASKIDICNTDRKNIQKDIVDEAVEQVENEKKNKKILILYGEAWHHGIIGIVAGRICEKYNKTTIMLTLTEDGENILGSARATDNVNIYEVLSNNKEYLVKFGGHAGAAGLSLKKENLHEFIKALENYADIYFAEEIDDNVNVDLELKLEDINYDVLNSIQKLAPYGEAFAAPNFCSFQLKVVSDRVTQAGHHFLSLTDGTDKIINAVIWNGELVDYTNLLVDISYTIYEDTYNGNNQIKLKIDNLIESNEVNYSLDVELIKALKEDIGLLIGKYPEANIFYEGPIAFKPDLPTFDLENMPESDEIILYSLPRNNIRLKQLIEKSKATKVILNYSYVPDFEISKFTKNFLGYIKHLVKYKQSTDTINNIAKIFNVDEEFVLTFVDFMTNQGYISYKTAYKNIVFDMVNSESKQNYNLGKIVKRYLKEKEEYTNYSL